LAILSNDRTDAAYLAVELTVDKRLYPHTAFSRGPVVSLPAIDIEIELEIDTAEGEAGRWIPTGAEWPPVDRTKVGWLNCTIKLVVGTNIIFEQTLLVQYGTFWEWYYMIQELLSTEHEEERSIRSGGESPELRMELRRSPIDPDLLFEDDDARYCYSLMIYVDTSIAAGEPMVCGEGPGMFFYPKEAALLTFAQQLIDEADQAG
jgi:hypothetical protein